MGLALSASSHGAFASCLRTHVSINPSISQSPYFYYEIATGVDSNKTEFRKACSRGKENLGGACWTQLLVQWLHLLTKILYGFMLGLEDNLGRIEISNIKFMNIEVPALKLRTL